MVEFTYRPDVDGLRAVAVSLVLLFHAGLGFSGGYIGVDVFFVISGYLITGLILRDQSQDRLSLVGFWKRRICRIFPAASFMVFVTLVLGFLVLLPSDFLKLGKSVVANQAMLSNVYFFRNTGYFDGPAELMPLLHTWSLAVEEQFYLGFPFLLVFLNRIGRRLTLFVLCTLSLFSLGISQYGILHFPEATFFLLPMRAWELLLGSLVWFLPTSKRVPLVILDFATTGAFAGLVLLAWIYDAETPFPGVNALLPCILSALLIYCNTSNLTRIGRLLSWPPFVGVGLISYSLYLWHWPILVFARTYYSEELPMLVGVACLLVSFCVAYLSWRCIETPFRRLPKELSFSKITVGWVLTSSFLFLLGGYVWQTRGLIHVHASDDLALDPASTDGSIFKYETSVIALNHDDVPRFGPAGPLELIVLGDSHAMSLGSLVEEFAQQDGMPSVVIANRATVPVLKWRHHGDGKEKWRRAAIDFVLRNKPANVLLVARWTSYFETYEPKQAELFDRTISLFQDAGISVWILRQVPELAFDVPQRLWLSQRLGTASPSGVPVGDYLESRSAFTKAPDEVNSSGKLLDPLSTCFDEDGLSKIRDASGVHYRDRDHLSESGSKVLIGDLLGKITSN